MTESSTKINNQPGFTGYYQGILRGARGRLHSLPVKPIESCVFGDTLVLSTMAKCAGKSIEGLTASTKGSGNEASIVLEIPRKAYEKAFGGVLGRLTRLGLEKNALLVASAEGFQKIINNPKVEKIKFEIRKGDLERAKELSQKTNMLSPEAYEQSIQTLDNIHEDLPLSPFAKKLVKLSVAASNAQSRLIAGVLRRVPKVTEIRERRLQQRFKRVEDFVRNHTTEKSPETKKWLDEFFS